jgi:hypothetical protein
MSRRYLSASLGVMAPILLSAAFSPSAVASPDTDGGSGSYDHAVPAHDTTQTFTGFYGSQSPPPTVPGSVQTDGHFDAVNGDGDTLGSFDAHAATTPDALATLLGSTNDEYLVTGGDYAPAGSVFDTFTLGDSGFENVYADVASPDGDVVTDTFKTPFGDIDLTPFYRDFDVASGIADDKPTPTALPPGIEQNGHEDITAISGAPPIASAVQGNQKFDVVGDDDHKVGSFDAANTTTQDSFGFHTQAFLVTDLDSGTTGTETGDVPPVGSVFNTIDFGDGLLKNYYSAEPTSDGDVVTDTLKTPFGTIDLSPLFQDLDAAAGLADGSPTHEFAFGDGYQIVPNDDAEFTGVNGLPPSNASIQGHQSFGVTDNDDNTVGTFQADATTTPNMISTNDSQALVVTDVGSSTAGTEPGDVPPVGSVFDTFDLFGSDSGFENVYSDLPSSSGNVISDTLVTPFGDIDLSPFVQDLDAAAGLDGIDFS